MFPCRAIFPDRAHLSSPEPSVRLNLGVGATSIELVG
jgi:hypothetical protein